jgi:hypothetical protein
MLAAASMTSSAGGRRTITLKIEMLINGTTTTRVVASSHGHTMCRRLHHRWVVAWCLDPESAGLCILTTAATALAAWLFGYLQSSVPHSSSAEHCTPGNSLPRQVGCWYEHSMSPGMTLTSCTATPLAQYMRTRSALSMACTQQPAGNVKLS